MVALLSTGANNGLERHSNTSGYNWLMQRVKVRYPPLPLGIGVPPNPLQDAEVTQMLDSLSALCSTGPCRAHLRDAIPPLQDRALSVLAMTRGIDLHFGPICPGSSVPLGRLRATIIVCDAVKSP